MKSQNRLIQVESDGAERVPGKTVHRRPLMEEQELDHHGIFSGHRDHFGTPKIYSTRLNTDRLDRQPGRLQG